MSIPMDSESSNNFHYVKSEECLIKKMQTFKALYPLNVSSSKLYFSILKFRNLRIREVTGLSMMEQLELRLHLLTFPETSLLRAWSKDQQHATPGTLLTRQSLRFHHRRYKSESAFNVIPKRSMCTPNTEKVAPNPTLFHSG